MKALRSSDAQIARILKQGEGGMPVTEVCRKAGVRISIGRKNVSA